MLKNVPREQVLKVVKQTGPTIPARIVREVGGDTFLIGAILSDLIKNKLLKVSSLKLGGSPFYYAPEHAARLQEFSKHLKEQDKKTYDLLKEQKVLKDEEQSPLLRVSLRNIKDFAKPVEVKIGDTQELFWKFYLVPNDEVKQIIKDKFMKRPEKPEPRAEPEKPIREKPAKEKPEQEVKEKPQKEISPPEVMKDPKGSFGESIAEYFRQKNIEMVEKNIIRKTEIDYVVRVPSSIGTVEYYCKAKDKKRCNDGDIATAFIQGQNKKLPVLFLTTGEITKKAKDMLHREFKGVVVNRLA